MSKRPAWAGWLHFGIAATGVVTTVAAVLEIVPVPGLAVAGAVLAATAHPVSNLLARQALKEKSP